VWKRDCSRLIAECICEERPHQRRRCNTSDLRSCSCRQPPLHLATPVRERFPRSTLQCLEGVEDLETRCDFD
jgi:hypothetical protein